MIERLDIGDPRTYVGYIAALHKKNRKLLGRCVGVRPVSPAQILSAHGRSYDLRFGRCKPMERRQCYANAGKMAIDEVGRTYVEGWATTDGLAMEHAWCVDRGGRIYDPTWKGLNRTGETGTAYYGIPFPREVLREVTLETGRYGIFAQWWEWGKVYRILKRRMPEICEAPA